MDTKMLKGLGTALLTPFKGEEVDYGAFAATVDWQVTTGVDFLVPLGTTVDPSVVAANPTMMIVISALALVTNCVAICYIIYVSKKRHINPYKEDVFVDQKYYKDAMARADMA